APGQLRARAAQDGHGQDPEVRAARRQGRHRAPVAAAMARARAVAAHEIPDRPPLRVAVGEAVQVGARGVPRPAFVLVTTASGSGWVPARHIDLDGEPPRMVAAYDTTELATSAGEDLTVLARDDPSGWLWVRNARGQEGWVPAGTVEPADP